MTNWIKVIGLLVVLWPFAAFGQDAAGRWKTEPTEDGYLVIEVSPCGAALCGTIIRAVSSRGLNGDNYPHLGRRLIWDMQANGAGKWSNGKIWDPRNDRTYNSRMELRGANLSVSGCFLGVCQSQVWQPAS